jgi:hypothetical protein
VPPNEKGFVVGISNCVDKRTLDNGLVLKKGDVMTVETFYDVDPKSQRNAPFPGGKHGGIMALFFAAMHCDPGTYGEKYVCRQGQCIGVKRELPFMRVFKDYESCSERCDRNTPIEADEYPVLAKSVDAAQVAQKGRSPKIGKVAVAWSDCGTGKAFKTTFLTPASINLGGLTKITGTVILLRSIAGGNFTMKMSSGLIGLTFFDFSGDICSRKAEYSLDGQMRLSWEGATCPLPAGNASISVGLNVGFEIPAIAASTTTTVVVHDSAGDLLWCMEVLTEGFQKEADLLI